jgi:hypothetical protein
MPNLYILALILVGFSFLRKKFKGVLQLKDFLLFGCNGGNNKENVINPVYFSEFLCTNLI